MLLLISSNTRYIDPVSFSLSLFLNLISHGEDEPFAEERCTESYPHLKNALPTSCPNHSGASICSLSHHTRRYPHSHSHSHSCQVLNNVLNPFAPLAFCSV